MEILDYSVDFDGMRLNEGSQEEAFLCNSDIVIYVGNRGVGKSFFMLAKALPHIGNKKYRCIYFRKMLKEQQGIGGIADKSREVFGQFGKFLESPQNLRWEFQSGAKAVFGNYSAPESEFANSIQGVEYYHAFIDEVTQISEDRFNAIFSNLRNTEGARTQIIGVCNADPGSWMSRLVGKWIDPETGYHIPEMNGVELYFYQWGNDISESFWGRTREEVLGQAERYIDEHWNDEMAKYGSKLDLILSITVFEGKMSENKHLMKSQGVKYYGKLLKGSLDMKARYARACWKKVDLGESEISDTHLERFFNNSEQRSGVKYASLDVAGNGSDPDKVVLWIWDGFHVTNVYSTRGLNPKELLDWVKRILSEEGVHNKNFIYDGIGVGWIFDGFFTESVKFMSQSAASEESKVEFDGRKINVYRNAKSEVVGRFLDILKNHNNAGECGVSIDNTVLNKTFFGKTVREHLMEEKRVIMWRTDREGIKQVIDKKETKKILGHSPDWILSLIYRMALDKKFTPMTDEKVTEILNFLSF